MDTIFNSRDPFFRNPTGAVCQNTKIHFKIVLPRHLKCSGATLYVFKDDNTDSYSLSMYWCGKYEDSFEMWECDFSPKDLGLFWYSFKINTISGEQIISKSSTNNKAQIEMGSPWQITVYKSDFTTPNWLSGGIMYQIFPDRFFYSGEKKENIPKDRTIQKDWNCDLQWWPDENGEYTNSDYFCGDLLGITQKLDYLKSLGVTCIYLNPIFESHSNHRYNTADYLKIDPILGSIDDFTELCNQAKKRNIHLILDGVFSHTGSDSIYFNKEKRYNDTGAFNSKDSPYYSWYNFLQWPNQYEAWWGFSSLPETQETNPGFNEFINGENGVVRKWIKNGCSGWRLDVADELPDCFIENLREAVKKENPESLILGEVWEDASNKTSYSARKKYLLGNQLDSVMNYPFRSAVLEFLRGESGKKKIEQILEILENYPKQVVKNLMNPISTHDTKRAITDLAGEHINGRDRKWQAKNKLSDEQKKLGIKLMKTASAMQYTLPGVPCIYYGDEVGVEGYKDPFNRKCFPWGNENKELLNWYKELGKIRKNCSALKEGDFIVFKVEENLISYIRKDKQCSLFCAFNSSNKEYNLILDEHFLNGETLLNSKIYNNYVIVPAYGCALIKSCVLK